MIQSEDNLSVSAPTTGDFDRVFDQVLSKEQQEALSIEDTIQNLKAGNESFMNDELSLLNTTQRVRASANGQYPEAVILSCIDSRVPV
ncbi:hypothetical protein VSO92_08790 [Myroides pelagicus]|uniref:hypothetical protein n=1 Tax=Myroides pelagicus TaxID=270914 RepID=UPI002DBEA632|nr:hypothetical protein [Myroides pelagicus]MEC4114203.1 hypothetical protein [Myroides pelagicus]